jgi:hypothetical protein
MVAGAHRSTRRVNARRCHQGGANTLEAAADLIGHADHFGIPAHLHHRDRVHEAHGALSASVTRLTAWAKLLSSGLQ